MREVTLNQLRMLIDNTVEDLKNKKNELTSNSLKIVHKDVSGHEEVMSLDYNFEQGLLTVEDLTQKLITYKEMLQKANLETLINEVDTISSALIKLEQKRALVKTLDHLCFKEERKSRKIDSSYSNSYYIEHIQLNFDKEALVAKKEALREEINTLEAQVDNANSVTKVVLP